MNLSNMIYVADQEQTKNGITVILTVLDAALDLKKMLFVLQ